MDGELPLYIWFSCDIKIGVPCCYGFDDIGQIEYLSLLI
jgi:hypothetical protein